MKLRTFFLILIIVILLVSCQNSSNKNNDISLTNSEPPLINLYFSSHIKETKYNEEQWQTDYKTWHDLLLKEYNVNVNINLISPLYYDEFISGTYIVKSIEKEEFDGLVRLRGHELASIGLLKNSGFISPLDTYLSDNSKFLNLPDAMISPFIIDGKLYAIPSGFSDLPSFRLVKKDLLTKVNLPIPENINSYYNMLKEFKKIDNIIPMAINGTSIYMYELKDLFYANGCYPSYNGVSSINYDPLTGAIEDYILKPGAKDTFLFLNTLMQEGLLQVTDIYDIEDYANNNNLGTYYREITGFSDSIEKQCDIIWYLKGTNDIYLNSIISTRIAYVLPSNASNPYEVVNGFVNTFLLNQDGYFLGRMGLEGVSYYKDGDTIITYNNDYMGVSDDYLEYQSNGTTTYQHQSGYVYFENLNKLSEVSSTLLQKQLMFPTSYYPFVGDLGRLSTLHNQFFAHFINQNGDIDVNDFINEYISDARRFGAPDILDSINKTYGTKSSYSYYD